LVTSHYRVGMTDDLHDALTDIQGVGDATAEKIIDVVAEHGTDAAHLREALEYLEAGEPGYASKYVRRALGE